MTHSQRPLANHENQLGLIVQSRDAVGANHGRSMANQTAVQFDEASGFLRNFFDELGAR